MNNGATQRTWRPAGMEEVGAPMPGWLLAAVVVLGIVGLLARLSPLLDVEGRLFWQYMTEDGYLMQTVARNMAIGLGMSTAEGSIPTNGVQPLATYLFAGLHVLASGDKTEGIVLVTLLSVVISVLSAWLLAKVGQQVFAGLRFGREMAWVAAALWFTAPLITRHSMNGLETGLYQAATLLVMHFYLSRLCAAPQPSWGTRLVLGVLLGLAFLSRNDAVFFIAALLVSHLLISANRPGESFGSRMTDALVAGTVSILVASPWLINNYLGFGSIVPISGTAQSHAAEIGRNLPWLAAHLFENTWLWAPIPGSLEQRLPVQVVCALAIIAAVGLYWRWVARDSVLRRRHFVTGVLFAGSLSTYYGLFFGASWFLPRYLSAASPFLWLFVVAAVVEMVRRMPLPASVLRQAAPLAVVVLTLLAAVSAANDWRKGTGHMHKQVVEWTQANVAPEVWVAAPQTGTLGYFHDRTINLDGKVNPEALRRLLEDGHSLDYVLESPAQYIIDWVGMAEWVTYDHLNPRFGQEFRVREKDVARNLAVLERVGLRP